MTLDKKLFKRLVESMGQMDEIVRGARAPSREFYVDAAKVKEIRAFTGLSQPKFARLLDVDVGTLRNREQGRREPTGPAQALLRQLKKIPGPLLKALTAWTRVSFAGVYRRAQVDRRNSCVTLRLGLLYCDL